MKPIIILPKGAVSRKDIDLLNANDLCVVEADDPAAVKFVDPIPAMSSRTKIEDAAIQLSRRLMNGSESNWDRRSIVEWYVHFLVKGTPLSDEPTEQEIIDRERRRAKIDEAKRLGKAEAKAEYDAKKEVKAKEKAQ